MREEILSALTETERKIVDAYLKHRGKARDLARMLGVSERTVYKALYKYRKLAKEHGVDPSAFYLRGGGPSSFPESPHESSHRSALSLEELKRELIAELIPVIEEAVSQTLKKSLEGFLLSGRGQGVNAYTSSPVFRGGDSDQITRLILSIEKLNENISKFTEALSDRYYSSTAAMRPQHFSATIRDSSLPSFAVDNPWLEVLSRKY